MNINRVQILKNKAMSEFFTTPRKGKRWHRLLMTGLLVLAFSFSALAQSDPFEQSITVLPKPSVSILESVVCMNDSVTVMFSGIAPFTLTYTPFNSGLPVLFGTGGYPLTLLSGPDTNGINHYSARVKAGEAGSFTFTLTSFTDNLCDGLSSPPQTHSILVRPLPTINPINDTVICNNSSINITFSGNLPTNTYNWERISGVDFIGASTGTDAISTALAVNSSNIPLIAVYEVTPQSVEGCNGTPETFQITLNPELVQNISATINSGDTYTANGFNESTSGVYYQYLTSTVSNCDSTVILNLTVIGALCDDAYDFEGNLYTAVELNGLCWFMQNMLTEYDNLGNPISSAIYNSPGHSDTLDNLNRFGRLYDFNTAETLCPTGWRLPTADEYQSLIVSHPSADLRMSGENYWLNEVVTNSTLLSIVPSGYYDSDADQFYKLLGDAYLWTSIPVNTQIALACHFFYGCPELYIIQVNKNDKLSVRCVK